MSISDLTPGTVVAGLIAHGNAEVVSVRRHGSAMTVTFRDVSTAKVDEVLRSQADRVFSLIAACEDQERSDG